ncbi:hypothetical protein SynBIOSE41_02881 [Synechococcus sp. BIOS-E4-1]|uniref:hypothetical protein n=1 Tax=Synechococcus sp. BIOS-E4-1 TaxID=1400864 RepID=UPI0016488B2B|nr:hypothetical protein [Synechococcus sp. BIOS-E4-1]QNI55369.1 hypothetical protein SynBIOSE41_02881 [Synechococcus sp. BIOS-E4-1]
MPVEIGTDIRCADDKKGSSCEANLCPSWKDRLLAMPKSFTDNPAEMLNEARKPFDKHQRRKSNWPAKNGWSTYPTKPAHCCQQRTASHWISGSYGITALGLPKM